MNEQTLLSLVLLMAVGPVGLVITARTLYLSLRRFAGLGAALAAAATGTIMLLVAAVLYFVFGLNQAVFVLCIFGAAETIIMGSPLARYHVLLKLDPAVAARVSEGPCSSSER